MLSLVRVERERGLKNIAYRFFILPAGAQLLAVQE
jgi:hypothetical protein